MGQAASVENTDIHVLHKCCFLPSYSSTCDIFLNNIKQYDNGGMCWQERLM